MRDHVIKTRLVPSGTKRLTVNADNCSGQNKNYYVQKFLLAHVDLGIFEHVDYKFFVKRHTNNSCNCGFGRIRNYMATTEC
ncbi:hypothetical protein PC116_g15067 [Phytophthora cactorum]|nr:hypothetical protein PC116_g15067 [Phytophthora cactorum]